MPIAARMPAVMSVTGEPDGKASFDPTPGRTWKVKNATFSLRRGLTHETDDVYADQLDDDFSGYFSGSVGHVGPWNAPIRAWRLESETTWHQTKVPPVPEPAPSFEPGLGLGPPVR